MRGLIAFYLLVCFVMVCTTVGYCWSLSSPGPPPECHDWAMENARGLGAPEYQELFDTCMKERGLVSP